MTNALKLARSLWDLSARLTSLDPRVRTAVAVVGRYEELHAP
jgi:hypothetical protein